MQADEQEKIFTMHISEKDLYPEYKALLQINKKGQST